jgi:hypothetical protein
MSQDYYLETVEEFPVALQVAMIGSDGWLLASDRRKSEIGGPRYSSASTKIIKPSELAYAFSGDDCAVVAGDALLKAASDGLPLANEEALRRELKVFGDRIWQRENRDQNKEGIRIFPDRRARALIILFADAARPLWLLQIGRVSMAQPIRDKIFAGDTTNTAKFFRRTLLLLQPIG